MNEKTIETRIKDAIIEMDYPTKRQLWKVLSKRRGWESFDYSLFCTFIDLFIEEGKILVDERDDALVWVWNPEMIKVFCDEVKKIREREERFLQDMEKESKAQAKRQH